MGVVGVGSDGRAGVSFAGGDVLVALGDLIGTAIMEGLGVSVPGTDALGIGRLGIVPSVGVGDGIGSDGID